MRTSAEYWERRYADGGSSGDGSYGKFCEFKASVINQFIEEHAVMSVIDMGCGDGNQASLFQITRYLGIDVSQTILARCHDRFADRPLWRFQSRCDGAQAQLALSMDVIYHLIEDDAFDAYMTDLFDAALRFVVIYSSNQDEQFAIQAKHIRHRKFSDWIALHRPEWKLMEYIPNIYPWEPATFQGTYSDFWIYAKEQA